LDVTQRKLVVGYRRFGINSLSHLQKSSSARRMPATLKLAFSLDCLTLEDGADVVPKRRLLTTKLYCVTSQRSEDIIYTATEAGSHANIRLRSFIACSSTQKIEAVSSLKMLAHFYQNTDYISSYSRRLSAP
jgi:hypothetical protein